MSRRGVAIVTPITIGWHLKHIILGTLLTGGVWLFTGYPLCLLGRRRANRMRFVDFRDAAVPSRGQHVYWMDRDGREWPVAEQANGRYERIGPFL